MLARLRLLILAVLALGLMGSLASAIPAFAQDAEQPPAPDEVTVTDSDGDGVFDASDDVAAAAAAASQDQPVEDLSQRTETVTVVANPDGTFTRKQFATPVRIKRGGDWVDVDYTLAKRADGSWAPKASPVDVSIAAGSAKEAARVTFNDGESLAVTWPTELPKPIIEGGVATYKLSNAADLVVAVTGSGVTTRLRLNEEPAADDPVFRFGLRTEGVDITESGGGMKVVDDEGRKLGATSTLVAWDATTDDAGEPTDVVPLQADLDQVSHIGDVTTHDLQLTTPQGYLSDPSTEYPVTIDPDISDLGHTRDTWVREGDTVSYGTEYRLISGKINGSANTHAAQAYLQFDNDQIAGKDITSAQLQLWQYYAYSCTDRRMNAYPVGSAWSAGMKYPDRPAVLGVGDSTYVLANRGATGCSDGLTTLDVTNMAKAWAAGKYTNNGIRLTADDPNYSSYERRFCSFNPDTATSCGTAARTPHLAVTYFDRNYGTLTPLTPATVFTTLPSSKLSPGESRDVQVTGVGGVPASAADGHVAVRVSVQNWDGPGSVTTYRGDDDRPDDPTLSFAGVATASSSNSNSVVVGLSYDGTIVITNNSEFATDARIDVLGWYPAPVEAMDTTDTDDPTEPADNSRTSSEGTCDLPDGTLSAADLPQGSSVIECDAVGRILALGEQAAQIPEPGIQVSASSLSTDGTEEMVLTVNDEGIITYDSEDLQSGGTSGSPSKCSDSAYHRNGFFAYSYKWWIGDGGMPGGLSRDAAQSQFQDAINNITDTYNACGYGDKVYVKATYGGKTSYESDFKIINSGTDYACGSRDSKSTWDAGDLGQSSTLAAACWWTRTAEYPYLLESDVRFNTHDFNFTAYGGSSSCSGQYDIRGVGTHEAGHVFGMGHVSEADHGNLTMSTRSAPCDPSPRKLGKGDVLGLDAIYP
jgi:hypothetical protein